MNAVIGVAEALQQRRSIRAFEPEHKMSDEEFHYLMEHVRLSPTANNIQNWRFVRVTDEAEREAIRCVGFDQAQMTEASELIIFCYHEKAWQESPERYWKDAAPEVAEVVLANFPPYFTQEGVEHDEGVRSCGMAAMSTMLLAKEMGYDTCPMTGFDFDAVGKIIALPPHHRIAMMVAIGKRKQAAWPRGGQLPYEEVVINNRFG